MANQLTLPFSVSGTDQIGESPSSETETESAAPEVATPDTSTGSASPIATTPPEVLDGVSGQTAAQETCAVPSEE
ncbi:hypothetical protein HQQ80_05885 [Microbacteriaceae bacterium VKM Ac-2855]|nr:hypothetical protein [Microbacteriaceae bacterium VKM Ac-2855]